MNLGNCQWAIDNTGQQKIFGMDCEIDFRVYWGRWTQICT